MKRILAALLSVTLLALSVAGCAKPEGPPAEGSGLAQSAGDVGDGVLTVTDLTGRVVEIKTPVERVVALTAANCEILFALGAGDKLVGRGEYCDYPAEALAVPAVPSGADINLEQILTLKPQVVFMSSMGQTTEQVQSLTDAGIAVVVCDAQDIEGVYRDIAVIGQVLGKESQAQALVEEMRARFAAIAAKVPEGGAKPTVYFEVSPLEYGLWAAGSGTFMDELAGMLGLTNIFADVSGWAEVSQEQVLERNPDIIVTITMYYGEGSLPEDEILSRAGWQNVKAVRDGHVYPAGSDEISRPGPRLADAAEQLYDRIYGQG